MHEKDAKELISKYQSGNCSAEEKILVENWLTFGEAANFDLSSEELEKDLNDILQKILIVPGKRSLSLWPRIISAAAILMVIAAGSYFLNLNYGASANLGRQTVYDVQPGGNRAVLTLADGKKIDLNNAENGKLAEQAGITISKTKKGQLIYSIAGSDIPVAGMTNTITTPRGGTYQINLPDGTQVWLNAESSLKFPIHFESNKRKVELNGEAYFEVAKLEIEDKGLKSKGIRMPFIVVTGSQQVEVLGTHFNINSYTDEPATKTTLLEGSVRVVPSFRSETAQSISETILKPGQQSILQGNKITVEDIETDEAIAWKNGLFLFSNETLESIMRKIARWYNVEVEYKDQQIKKYVFLGSISRFENVSVVIKMLEQTENIHFDIRGSKIIVNKK